MVKCGNLSATLYYIHNEVSLSDKKKGSESNKNVWDILEILINKGAIFTLSLLIFSAFVLISAWRVPAEDLSSFWVYVGQISKTHWAISTAILLVSNLGWWLVHKKMKKLYKEEIKRLTQLRHDLMHGKNITIIEHVSSEDGKDKVTMLTPATDEKEV